jgi:hypothetical protein
MSIRKAASSGRIVNERYGDFSSTCSGLRLFVPILLVQDIRSYVGKMTRRHLAIVAAWLLHIASWFLPAVKGLLGSRLDHGIPGWSVFLSQTCALRPCDGASTSIDPWYGTAISVIGVATTILFVLVSPWIVWRGSRKLLRAAALVAACAFVVNAQWYVFYVPDRSDLGIGYFLWCASFGLLAIGLFWLTRKQTVELSPQTQSVLL